MSRRVGRILILGFVGTSLLSSAACEGKKAHPSATQTEPERVASSLTPRLGTNSEAQPLPPASLPPAPTADTGTSRAQRRLVNASVGYSLDYPSDWQLRGQVVATEFASDAECQGVQIIDFQPPQGSGARILHSFVQICARPLEDALTLEQFMIQTYSNLLGEQFEPVKFAGRSAYRTRNAGSDTTTFLQTQNHRIQIVSAVAAEPDGFPIRAAQVEAILASLTFAG